MINYLVDIWDALVNVFSSMTFVDVLDIVLLSFILYFVIKIIKETRAEQLLKGIALFAVALFFLNQFEFKVMSVISDTLFNVSIIAFIVMFQPELRRALEKVGRAKVVKPITLFETVTADETGCMAAINQIALACEKLSRTATGALIVVERQTKLGEQIETGTIIKAVPSEELFRNIFFPNTPLHDGAVIIRDNLVYAAGCFLPKPQKEELINKELGSRHRAAIGMSEVSDAIVIIVSEETGMISIAENGVLERGFDRDKLTLHLRNRLLPEPAEQRKKEKQSRRKKKGGEANE
ncbi:MAG: diadenylate cyclase CdaA [Ruminiclostridium sp.]|nr:diadenylate cyclase CdaA [Ruminiclostridium sp.]